MSHDLTVVELELEDVLPLRTRHFRPLLEGIRPFRVEQDDAPDTRHYGAVDDRGDVRAVATYLRDPCPACPGLAGIRIFGFAVEEEYQGRGVGRDISDYAFEATVESFPDVDLLWGNARLESAEFWESTGYTAIGEPFEVKGRGTHVISARPLPGRTIEEILEAADAEPYLADSEGARV